MELFFDRGIVVSDGNHRLLLDPSRGTKKEGNSLAFVSHAHSDHVARHKSQVIMTPETSDLYPYDADSLELAYSQRHRLGGMSLELHNSNHILGSSQVSIEGDGEKIVYTGDFRLDAGIFGDRCDVHEADTLIIESTYGRPEYEFPEPSDVYSDIRKWVRRNEGKTLLFSAYALGKSQELIRLLNGEGISPLVPQKTADFNEAYARNGRKLDYVSIESEEGIRAIQRPFVGILPRSKIKWETKSLLYHQTGARVLTAFVTGWTTKYSFASMGADIGFPLSDHADYSQLMSYVEQSGAKKVYTVHGYDKELAAGISGRGIAARPLNNAQMQMSDYA